ncbi:hypothetical protein Daus18300_007018 [Diaporthe australafricana]|uniref:IBR domain-containing protein n=1 Tax=Diaporthe australafricana TaxID=127596 RepID=A0ABR3WQH2_9PEZI
MPSPDLHLPSLENELASLQKELTVLKSGLADINRASRVMRAEFKTMTDKHTQLARAFERCKTELWFATISSNKNVAARAEERMRVVIEEQGKIQRLLPDKYKLWAGIVRARNLLISSICECKGRIARKEEETHTLRPCGSLTCAHCGRMIGASALQKAKVNIKGRVARMLRAE